jgi:hypothetical protein
LAVVVLEALILAQEVTEPQGWILHFHLSQLLAEGMGQAALLEVMGVAVEAVVLERPVAQEILHLQARHKVIMAAVALALIIMVQVVAALEEQVETCLVKLEVPAALEQYQH